MIVCISLTGCKFSHTASKQSGKRGSTLEVLSCSADGVAVEKNSAATVDYSNASEGYIQVNYTGSNSKTKLQIQTPENKTYTFSLHGGYETFPLTGGNGSYHVSIFENISGTQYSTAMSCDINVNITNEYGPYLYPNQYVDYSTSKKAIAKSEDLAASADNDLDVVTNVYNYIISNFSYDYNKAETVQSGYLPDVDETYKTSKGICFDYAALMATMLRVQKIPTRLEIGYVGDVYHAWISVYIKDMGWINGIYEFDGKDWNMMDPTFASTSKHPKDFLPDNGDYLTKYVY